MALGMRRTECPSRILRYEKKVRAKEGEEEKEIEREEERLKERNRKKRKSERENERELKMNNLIYIHME